MCIHSVVICGCKYAYVYNQSDDDDDDRVCAAVHKRIIGRIIANCKQHASSNWSECIYMLICDSHEREKVLPTEKLKI